MTSTLTLLRTHVDTIAPLLADDLAACLREGTLARYLAHPADGQP